jgi:acetyl esterase
MLPLIIGPAGLAEVGDVEERTIRGLDGDVPIRIYRPLGVATGTLHFIHGGGWSVGNLATVEPTARRLCRDLSMVVVTSTYRLAPEHPFPAAYQDGLAAAVWVRNHVDELGGSGNPVTIGGDSAGSNLTAAICLGLREGDGIVLGIAGAGDAYPAFDAQLLFYPAVDLRATAWALSSRTADADPTLPVHAMRQCFDAYVGDHDPSDWRLSPLAAENLSALPPALIVVLQVDPLRDEAVAFATRLGDAGVPVDLIEFDNLTHGFVHSSAIVPAAQEALQFVLERFKALLRRPAALT